MNKAAIFKATYAQKRILEHVADFGKVRFYGAKKAKALDALETAGLITLDMEPFPNCGRPINIYIATITDAGRAQALGKAISEAS